MCEILVGVLITFYYFLSFCFGMDASVKCYIHTRTFLHKNNKKILNQKNHYNFQKSNSEFINRQKVKFRS